MASGETELLSDRSSTKPMGKIVADSATWRGVQQRESTCGSASELQQKQQRALKCLSAGLFLVVGSLQLVQLSITALAVQLAKGNRSVVISRLASMQSGSAALEFLLIPLTGRLSDTFGRKCVLQASTVVNALVRLSVALSPSWFTLTLMKMMGPMCNNVFRTSVDASLSDLFEGADLAIASAQVKMWTGLAMMVAPAIGGWLTQQSLVLPFAISCVVNLTNSILLWATFLDTTVVTSSLRNLKWTQMFVNPLSFLKLFSRGKRLGVLTCVTGLQSANELGNLPIDKLFNSEVAGLSFAQDGYYTTARGLSVFIGGQLAKPLLGKFGPRRFLDIVNFSGFLHFFIKACSRGPRMMFCSLIPSLIGNYNLRSASLVALHTKYALASGLGRGEAAAARNNFEAVFKIVFPQIFAAIYMRTRERPLLKGAPFWLSACLVIASHGILRLSKVEETL